MSVQEALDLLLKLPRDERERLAAELLRHDAVNDDAEPASDFRAMKPGLKRFLAQAGRTVADSPHASSDKYAHLREGKT